MDVTTWTGAGDSAETSTIGTTATGRIASIRTIANTAASLTGQRIVGQKATKAGENGRTRKETTKGKVERKIPTKNL